MLTSEGSEDATGLALLGDAAGLLAENDSLGSRWLGAEHPVMATVISEAVIPTMVHAFSIMTPALNDYLPS